MRSGSFIKRLKEFDQKIFWYFGIFATLLILVVENITKILIRKISVKITAFFFILIFYVSSINFLNKVINIF